MATTREMHLHEDGREWYFTILELGQEIYRSDPYLTNFAAAQAGMDTLNAMHNEHPLQLEFDKFGGDNE